MDYGWVLASASFIKPFFRSRKLIRLILSFNLHCRLAGDSVQSLFRIAVFNIFVKTVKYEKGQYFKGQYGSYFKQTIS